MAELQDSEFIDLLLFEIKLLKNSTYTQKRDILSLKSLFQKLNYVQSTKDTSATAADARGPDEEREDVL